jgi:hypothetical protein
MLGHVGTAYDDFAFTRIHLFLHKALFKQPSLHHDYLYQIGHRAVKKNFCNVGPRCVRIISGELGGAIVDIPVFVPQMTGIETRQRHHSFGIVLIPSHSSTFESLGKAATERLSWPRAYVVALLSECRVIRHGNTLG